MKVSQLISDFNLKVLSMGDDMEIEGCYISDLLSLAMVRVGAGNVWLTVQTNVNIIAVASLTDAACIVVPENMQIPQTTIDKAIEQGVTLLVGDKTAFEYSIAFNEVI